MHPLQAMSGPAESDASVFNQRRKPPITPNRQMINNPGNIWVGGWGWGLMTASGQDAGSQRATALTAHCRALHHSLPSTHHSTCMLQGRFYATLGREYVVPGTWEARKSFLAM